MQKWSSSFLYDSEGEVPKLYYSDGHVEAKEVEALVVSEADAGLSPNTMVIHLVLTSSTGAAVRYSWKFVVVTFLARFSCYGVGVVKKFLTASILLSNVRQFDWCVAQLDGSVVAEQTHEDIEVGEPGHVLGFIVV